MLSWKLNNNTMRHLMAYTITWHFNNKCTQHLLMIYMVCVSVSSVIFQAVWHYFNKWSYISQLFEWHQVSWPWTSISVGPVTRGSLEFLLEFRPWPSISHTELYH